MSILWKLTVKKKADVVSRDIRESNALVSTSYQPPLGFFSWFNIALLCKRLRLLIPRLKKSHILKINQKEELFFLIRFSKLDFQVISYDTT